MRFLNLRTLTHFHKNGTGIKFQPCHCYLRSGQALKFKFPVWFPARRFSTENLRKDPSHKGRQAETGSSSSQTQAQPTTSVDDESVDKPLTLRRGPLKAQDEAASNINIESGPLDGTLASWQWLSQLSPCYAVHGSQIRIIQSPSQFYDVLVQRSKRAMRRITFASLYLGTGSLEQDLVKAIQENLEANPDLQVKVLLDYARGSRGEKNSRTMLTQVMEAFEHSCQIYLYHTPTLRGARKKILPQRWNELIGIQHMKLYIFDNSVLISGANLSNDYFTNRQDRYFVIENCPDLADFYDGLISQVAKFSFQLDKSNRIHLDPQWSHHPATSDVSTFVREARNIIVSYYENCRRASKTRLGEPCPNESSSSPRSNTNPSHNAFRSASLSGSKDTWIFPLIQMGPVHISYDDQATSRIFESTSPGSTIRLATGYFNLTRDYVQKIIQKSDASYEILMAHPKANGFLGAKGPAGGIPAAYTLLATRFFNEVKDCKQAHRIKMWEYLKASWTFHSKGLWFYPAGENLPFVTLVGSPNFGYRSVRRDLETQLYIVTTNPELRSDLHEEQKMLYGESASFAEHVFSANERLVPLWVHMVIKFFKNYF